MTKTKKYHVHDPVGSKVGDKVEFIPCRPMSKTKQWIITRMIDQKNGHPKQKFQQPTVEPETHKVNKSEHLRTQKKPKSSKTLSKKTNLKNSRTI